MHALTYWQFRFLVLHLEQAGKVRSHRRFALTHPAQDFRLVSLRCTITTGSILVSLSGVPLLEMEVHVEMSAH